MTVCLTGDVHHMSLETRDQPYMDRTEMDAAVAYAEIAGSYEVPVTLFVTGKAVVEEPAALEKLASMDLVELGGHNYYAFDTLVHKGSRGLLGSWNGPAAFQGWEINRTVDAFARHGVDITAWRDHAYRHDENTAPLLADRGITHFSDAVGPAESVRTEAGLTVVPVNTPPDHEHVYHAFRTEEFVAESDFEGPFGTDSYDIDDWLAWVRERIGEVTDRDQPATVLAHPSCMDIADGLDAFEELCAVVAESHEAKHVSEIPPGT
jgi:hypothetical protein